MGARSAETLSGSERRSAEVWSTKETSRRRRAPVGASYRRLALGKYSRLVALRVRGREGGETGAGSAARVVVSSVAAFAFASESDAFGRGGAVPAEASARRNAEDASVISALPAASMTNARPSARRMITKGLGSGGCSARGMGGQASAGEGRSGETGNGRAEGNEQADNSRERRKGTARQSADSGVEARTAESSSIASRVIMFMLVVAPMRAVGVSRALMEVARLVSALNGFFARALRC